MNKKVLKRIGVILACLGLVSACFSSRIEIKDNELVPTTVPLGYVPYPQDGYGDGPNQLGQPDDVEILKDGRMVISDVYNNRIQVFDKDGKLVKSITHLEMGIESPEIVPAGVSKDGDGFMYVTLEGAGKIARFNPDMDFVQFIGKPGQLTADNYYDEENSGILMMPQGLIVSSQGDVFVIDMEQDVFRTKERRSFRIRKFIPVKEKDEVIYQEDLDFARSQEITTVMNKSEGMALSEEAGLLFIAEEKASSIQFGTGIKNPDKYRYIGVFDMQTGKFTGRLIGVTIVGGRMTNGYHTDSIEGLAVFEDYIFAVDEKQGKIYIYDIMSGSLLGDFGQAAYWYCDDHSDCVIDGINYNEQTIEAGIAKPHLLNDWRNNELASPDGVSVETLNDGTRRLAVVDQWNSRILYYDLDALLAYFNLKIE